MIHRFDNSRGWTAGDAYCTCGYRILTAEGAIAHFQEYDVPDTRVAVDDVNVLEWTNAWGALATGAYWFNQASEVRVYGRMSWMVLNDGYTKAIITDAGLSW